MKIRILDRILVAVAGLILIMACAGLVAQVFFGVDVAGTVTGVLSVDTTPRKILLGFVAAILLILGVYCLSVLFRHPSGKDRFILQKLENGDLAISLETLETMVRKCVEQHEEIKTESIRLENERDGLLITIRGIVAGGVSIPLTVDNMQKQIKQYVTACSGVEIKGVRVQIESTGEDATDAPFLIEPPARLPKGTEEVKTEEIPETSAAEAATLSEKTEEVPAAETSATSDSAAAAALAAAESMKNSYDFEEDDRPIHQQLFSTQEEPCIMPLPPENLVNSEEDTSVPAETTETVEATVASEPEETVKTEEEPEAAMPETAETEAEKSAEAEAKTEESATDETKGEENA